MPSYRVDIPGKGSFRVDSPEELTDGEAYYAVMRQLQSAPEPAPEPEAKPESGPIAAAKASLERLQGDWEAVKARFGSEGAAERAAAHRREAERIFKMPSLTEHPVDYVTSLLGAAAPYMAAPILAGLAATPAGAIPTLAATGLASAAQFTGSGLSRQLEEGTRPEELNLGAAVAAAVPSAALDVFALGKIPGIRNIIPGVKQVFGQAGIQIGNKEAAGVISRFVMPAFKAAGYEGATEAAQAVLERLQAGLDITNPEARQEYFDNFLGGAVLGGVLAVPGAALEGVGQKAPAPSPVQQGAQAGAQAVSPAAAPAEIPAQPEAAATAAPAVEAPVAEETVTEQPEVTEPTLRTQETAATPTAEVPATTVDADPIKLYDKYDVLKKALDPLAAQIVEADAAGDTTRVKELQAEHREYEKAMKTLEEQIKEAGGTTEAADKYEADTIKALQKLDSRITKLKTDASAYRDVNVRDYEAADKADAQRAKLEAERNELAADLDRKREFLRMRETPKNETGSLFPAETVQPAPTNMLTLDARTEKGETVAELEKKYAQATQGPQPKAPDYSKEIEAKEAEAEELLKELVAMQPKVNAQNKVVGGPQAASTEERAKKLAELNELRAKYSNLQDTGSRMGDVFAQPETREKYDAALMGLRKRMDAVQRELTAMSQQGTTSKHLALYNEKSDKLSQLYADIDSLRGGVQRTTPPPTLFSKRNQLVTAASTGDMDAVRRLLDYDAAQAKTETKTEPTLAEKGVKELESKVKGRKISQRIVFDDHYDDVMEEIETLRNKIVKPQGNAKKSILQRAEELYPEIEALEKYIADPKTSAVERGNKRRTLQSKIKDYEPLQNAMTNARDKIDELLRSLHTVDTVGTAAEIAAAEKQAMDIAGKSKREKSREQKSLEKDQKGTVKASPERVAQELGTPTDEYTARTKTLDTQIARLKAKLEKDKAYLKNVADTAKKKYGETSAEAKAAEAKMVRVTAAKQEAYYKAVGELNDKKDAIAKEIGRANPWFRSTLVKATKDVSESAATAGAAEKAKKVGELKEKVSKREANLKKRVDELNAVINDANASEAAKDTAKKTLAEVQRARASKGVTPESKLTNLQIEDKKSKRSTQETRKVAKLGTMSTGTPESQARSAARQAGFEAKLTEEKGEAADYARAQARKQTKKKAEGAEAATAVGQAMQKAAKAKIDKETPKQQRGSEIESKDLDAAQVEALEKDDVRTALNSIMEDETNSDVNRAVAAALEVYLDKTNVTVHDRLYADDGYELLGQATSKQIDISRRGLTQETLLHEGVHAAVERVIQMAKENFAQLSKEQQAAYRELERLYNAIKNDPSITSKNAKSSISEFAAEALSNERLQDQLRAKKWTLGDAFKSFTSFILKMLGVKNVDNMLDASLSAVEALMVPSSTRMDAVEDAVREQAKSVGVVEKGKGMFGFKSFTQPATQYNIVATEPAVIDKLKANFTGLAGRVQWVDKYAAISEAFAKGVDAKVLSDLEATNGEYLLRFGENVSQYAQQALTNGRMQLVKKKVEGGNEYLYKSEKGANLMRVYGELEKAGIANSTDLDNMFTIYMAGKRADKVGWDKLWVGDSTKAKQDYAAVMAQVNGSQKIKDAFEAAMKEYRAFNNGLLDFAEQCGALKPEEVAEFKGMDYVPYYRVNTNGNIELFSDQEKRLTIGNIKEEPHLQELVGDNSKILPLSVSAIQNAFLLTNMALRNNTVRDTSFLLRKMGIASAMNEGAGPAGYNTVRFKIKGVPHYALIDSDKFGIPADLIVKGMEGIKTTMPFIFKLMGKPADWVRKFVTRSPTYAVRQLIRDPMTAWMTTGVDGVPVLNALREMSSMVAGRSEVERTLMEAGAITSNVYTGGREDLDKFIRDVGAGKTGWGKWMARLDAFALQGDAATRAVIYKDSIAKGMSEQQALLRTLESMNFGRRGLSPTMQILNTLIPFFNSQIQGLDVIYRAFRGKMPYSQRLEIQQKLALRGAMLAAGTIAYAYMMQDDEAYKRAKPEERLANWFVRIPGLKDPLKIPVPFELGYIFKSLPEAIINAAAEDNRNKDITEGMGKLVWQSVPLSMPAALKPAVEIYMNKSFFGGDVESQREVNTLEPTQRYRNTTTELAKMIGGITGVAGLSPIKVDYLIRGYTGGLGITLASLLDPLMESDKAEPTKDPHQWPLVGGLFQASEGRGVRDAAYDRMLEIQQAKGTYKHLMQEGRREEAKQFLEENRHLISKASMSGRVQQQLGEWASLRRRVLDSATMTQEQKDERLDRLDQLSTRYAERFLQATE